MPKYPDLRRGAGKGIIILKANRCPLMGHWHHFDGAPLTSGLPQLADILRGIPHVSLEKDAPVSRNVWYRDSLLLCGRVIPRNTEGRFLHGRRREWFFCSRRNPKKVVDCTIPMVNPFAKMGLESSDRETPTANYEELIAFRSKAIELGLSSLATAAFDRLGMAAAGDRHLRDLHRPCSDSNSAAHGKPNEFTRDDISAMIRDDECFAANKGA